MTFEELIKSLNPDVYSNLKTAIELGRWPDGRKLLQAQRELCMEAVIYYENLHQIEESLRVGFIDPGTKKGSVCATDDHDHDHDEVAAVRLVH